MNIDINNIMQEAVIAHKQGDIAKAQYLYLKVLSHKAEHADANHNLGVLLERKGELKNALLHFTLALINNSKSLQFSLSHINALIKMDRIYDAKSALNKAISEGLKSHHFNEFISDISNLKRDQNIILSIEQYYKDVRPDIIRAAATGWFYSISFDKLFLAGNNFLSSRDTLKGMQHNHSTALPNHDDDQLSAIETIESIKTLSNVSEKYEKLRKIAISDHNHLIRDSFFHVDNTNLSSAQLSAFKKEALNIVIFGGGVTGLFLACILKNRLQENVNILVIDNRSIKPHVRSPFTRDWLTAISAEVVTKHTPSNIRELLECFGTGETIGIPINMLEAILMLSCKIQGVKFYFSKDIDYSELNEDIASFVFDATGGKIGAYERGLNDSAPELKVSFENVSMNVISAAVRQLDNQPNKKPGIVQFHLKPQNHLYYPYLNGSLINTFMLKITCVPKFILNDLVDLIKPHNSRNRFYVWEGSLKDKINQGLVLINLSKFEFDTLAAGTMKTQELKVFLQTKSQILNCLDDSVQSFLINLESLDNEGLIKIERPFNYLPHINLDSDFGHMNHLRMFPIGDSLFSGNPKVGNGLLVHFRFINELTERICKSLGQ